MGKHFFGNSNTSTSSESWLRMDPMSSLEQSATERMRDNYTGFSEDMAKSFNGEDVARGAQSSRDYATLLEQFKNGGFLPSTEDFDTANKFTNNAFAAQQTGLEQMFEDQTTQANRQAALMGRSQNDPVLRAKLAQEQMRQQQMLNSQKTAASSEFALQLPGQRLGYAGQLADVRNQLASQAMMNRQALLSLGSQIQSGERNWRFNTAVRVGQQHNTGAGTSFLGGASQVAGVVGNFMSAIGGDNNNVSPDGEQKQDGGSKSSDGGNAMKAMSLFTGGK